MRKPVKSTSPLIREWQNESAAAKERRRRILDEITKDIQERKRRFAERHLIDQRLDEQEKEYQEIMKAQEIMDQIDAAKKD